MKRIAIITPGVLPIPNVKGGGVELLIQSIIDRNEIEKKLDITIYSIWTQEVESISKGYKFTKFIFIKRQNRLWRIINYFLQFLKIKDYKEINFFSKKVNQHIKKNNSFDSIIIENNLNYLLNKDKNILGKCYYHIHNDDLNSGLTRQELDRYRKVLLQCEKIICVSHFIKEQVINSMKINNVVVLKNCIDINFFSDNSKYSYYRNEIREKFNIKEDEVLIMYSGRLIREKGVKELILAYKNIYTRCKARLIIVGAGFYSLNRDTQYVKEIKDLCSDIDNEVIFTGYINSTDINKYYYASDIVVVPTLYFEEAAGLVAIEAMASQKPLVISDSGGLIEYAEKTCSKLIERNNNFIENMERCLIDLVENPNLRKKMGNEGLKFSKDYNFENYYKNLLEIIDADDLVMLTKEVN